MPVFQSEAQVYQVLQTLFERMQQQNLDPGGAFAATHLVVRIKLSAPQSEITFNGKQNPVKVEYGGNKKSMLRPDLDIEMSADTFHKILLNELSLKTAFTSKQMKVLGPFWKTTPLTQLFENARKVYPQVVQDLGL